MTVLPKIRHSLKYRIAVIIFVLEGFMMAVVLSVTLSDSLNENRKQLRINEKVMMNLLSDLSRIALLTAEYDDLQPYIDQIVQDPNIAAVHLADYKNRIVVSSRHVYIGRELRVLESSDGEKRWRTRKINNSNGVIGTVAMLFSYENLISTNQKVRNSGITIALTSMVVIAVIGYLIGYLLTRRLEELTYTAQRFAKGEFEVRTNLKGGDEVAILGRAFNSMAENVSENMEVLRRIKDDLEDRVVERTLELAIARDQAISANRSKSAFLANMSHEIRTPLTAIIGFSEAIADGRLPVADQQQLIKIVIRSSKDLLRIINDILDFSKIEADRLEIDRLPTNPFDLIEDVYSLVALMAEEKGLLFRVDFMYPMPETINTDTLRLKQILINLCNNAIKFTKEGYVLIEIRCIVESQKIIFAVIDTGIGINEDQLEKLFQPFSQADSSTTREYGGTGLGLHLSRILAGKLGGSLAVESEEGAGSRLTVEIDTGNLDGVKMLEEGTDFDTSGERSKNSMSTHVEGHVLLVEDNEDNQRLISMFIQKTGAKVDIASDGVQAIEMTSRKNYDLILMDLQMPNMNGLDATREIRERGFTGPIIALTANAMKTDIDASTQAGCDEHLSKPIDRVKFLRLFNEYLVIKPGEANVDLPIISSLLYEEPDLLAVVEKFISRLPEMLQKITAANKAGDMGKLRHAAHDLKGTGGNFGYAEIYSIAEQIENKADGKNAGALPELIAEVASIIKRIQDGLKHFKQSNNLDDAKSA